MSTSQNDLLQPTLDSNAPVLMAPYSVQTTFFTGFFGGPLAALGIIGLNSYRLCRLSRDLPSLIALGVAVLAATWFIFASPSGLPVLAWITDLADGSGRRIVTRFLGLLFVGAGYLLHRREQRNANLLDVKRPNGWIGGSICFLVGGVLFALFLIILQRAGS
jgi:hypothetical protein